MTDFSTWNRDTLNKFAEEASAKLIELEDKVKSLERELGDAKIYLPAQRTVKQSAPAQLRPTNFAFYGIVVEDNQFEGSDCVFFNDLTRN